jgi:hypothetical protein
MGVKLEPVREPVIVITAAEDRRAIGAHPIPRWLSVDGARV